MNKSFKFQSDWPYNNSQVYILNSIVDDLNKDSELVKEESDGKYIFTSKVTYPNNNKLVSQRVTVTKDLFVESVEVLNEEGTSEMTFKVKKTDYNPTFDESYFEVNSIINSANNNQITDNNKDSNTKQDNNTQNNTNKSDESSNETNTTSTCNSTDETCKSENNNIKQESSNNISLNATQLTMTMNGDEPFTQIFLHTQFIFQEFS